MLINISKYMIKTKNSNQLFNLINKDLFKQFKMFIGVTFYYLYFYVVRPFLWYNKNVNLSYKIYKNLKISM